ncbi:excitatory amino acid transporter 3-like [Lineus longissimus]|uniref:excitatory amino acid transporter 3-like n=1 Tax=Lineus longissimus TaxID=88925 RepID=UPI00315CE82A
MPAYSEDKCVAKSSLMQDFRVQLESDNGAVQNGTRRPTKETHIMARGEGCGDGCKKCECSGRCCKKWLKNNLLLILMLVSMVAGIGLGVGLRYVEPRLTDRDIIYLKFPGDLLLRMLKMLILPLIISSLISGLAALDTRASGSMGAKAVLYYLTTTVSAVILGIVLVVLIKPGEQKGGTIDRVGSSKIVNPADALMDLVRNMFPENLVLACFKQTKTEQVPIPTLAPPTLASNVTISPNATDAPMQYRPVTGTSDGTNVLGIVVFSIAFGMIISRMGEKCRPLVAFFSAMNEAVMALIGLVIWYSPIGVLFLVASKIVEMENIETALQQLGLYIATVLAGLAIHGFIILPLLYLIFVRKNPFKFVAGILQALVTALATASSSATLPVTFRCLEENLKIDRRVTRFVLPIGATINMDGTALYEAVASIFIAQVNGIWLNIGQIIIVSITSTAASIGAAGVPQAGLVTMVIVLTAVGLPTEDITLILAVDWFLDRCRTTINVLGDAIGASIIDKYSQATLRKLDAEDAEGGDGFDSIDKNGYPSEGHDYHGSNATNTTNL